MHKFEKSSFINCDINDLFDFHLDVNNIKKITPSDTKVEILEENFIPEEGKILRIKTTKFFIPTLWEVKIQKLDRPYILVDVALKSPFSYWKHSHIFKEENDVCILKDEIEFKLPLGFIGNFFSFFIIKQLQSMFDFRHKITKEILESKIFTK